MDLKLRPEQQQSVLLQYKMRPGGIRNSLQCRESLERHGIRFKSASPYKEPVLHNRGVGNKIVLCSHRPSSKDSRWQVWISMHHHIPECPESRLVEHVGKPVGRQIVVDEE